MTAARLAAGAGGAPAPAGPGPARRARWRRLTILLLAVAGLLACVRLALPTVVRWSVNRALDQNLLYDGVIGDVTLHLWRGAYAIDDVRLFKTTGNVPAPFFAAKRVELAIEWPSVWAGRLVGRMVLEDPELNFVHGADASRTQTGAGAPWLQVIKDLFPFRINGCEIRNGTAHFRATHKGPAVDVYVSRIDGSIENLTNIHDDVTPLFATVRARGTAMDHAQVEYEMRLDPLAYRPTFQLAVRLLGLDVTKLNALSRAYAELDFEHGWFDLVVELDAQHGFVRGYVKPLFRNLEVFDPGGDGGNLLNLFWQALAGAAAELFKNRPRDQVATLIPLEGELGRTRSDILQTIGNLLRNAFVRAYLPRLQGVAADVGGVAFGEASIDGVPPPAPPGGAGATSRGGAGPKERKR
jgi:hypothetical protein